MDLASPQHPAGERQWVLGCRSMQVSGAGDEGQRPSTEPGVGKGGVPLFSPSFGSFSWRRKKRTNIPRGPGPQLRGNPPAGGTAGAQHPQGVRRIRKAAEPPTAVQCAPLRWLRAKDTPLAATRQNKKCTNTSAQLRLNRWAAAGPHYPRRGRTARPAGTRAPAHTPPGHSARPADS